MNATKSANFIRGKPVVEFMDELVPSFIAAKIREIGARVDVLAVVAVDHPLVSEAVEEIVAKGKPVFTLLSDLTTPARSGYIAVARVKLAAPPLGPYQGWQRSREKSAYFWKPSLSRPGNCRNQFQELHA